MKKLLGGYAIAAVIAVTVIGALLWFSVKNTIEHAAEGNTASVPIAIWTCAIGLVLVLLIAGVVNASAARSARTVAKSAKPELLFVARFGQGSSTAFGSMRPSDRPGRGSGSYFVVGADDSGVTFTFGSASEVNSERFAWSEVREVRTADTFSTAVLPVPCLELAFLVGSGTVVKLIVSGRTTFAIVPMGISSIERTVADLRTLSIKSVRS